MKEQLISFNTAKLAKEKGFDVKTPNVWYNNGVSKCRIVTSNTIFDSEYYAPTQSLLQKWLYEKHQIWVNSRPVYSSNEQLGIQVVIYSWKFPYKVIEEDGQFNVYAGLEKGLQEALKLI